MSISTDFGKTNNTSTTTTDIYKWIEENLKDVSNEKDSILKSDEFANYLESLELDKKQYIRENFNSVVDALSKIAYVKYDFRYLLHLRALFEDVSVTKKVVSYFKVWEFEFQGFTKSFIKQLIIKSKDGYYPTSIMLPSNARIIVRVKEKETIIDFPNNFLDLEFGFITTKTLIQVDDKVYKILFIEHNKLQYGIEYSLEYSFLDSLRQVLYMTPREFIYNEDSQLQQEPISFNISLAVDQLIEFLDMNNDLLQFKEQLDWEYKIHQEDEFGGLLYDELKSYNITLNKDCSEPKHKLNFGFGEFSVAVKEEIVKENNLITSEDIDALFGLDCPINKLISSALARRFNSGDITVVKDIYKDLFKPYHIIEEVYNAKFSNFDKVDICNLVNSHITPKEFSNICIIYGTKYYNEHSYFKYRINTMEEAFQFLANKFGYPYNPNIDLRWSYSGLISDIIENDINMLDKFYNYIHTLPQYKSLFRLPKHMTLTYLLFMDIETLHGFIINIWGDINV